MAMGSQGIWLGTPATGAARRHTRRHHRRVAKEAHIILPSVASTRTTLCRARWRAEGGKRR